MLQEEVPTEVGWMDEKPTLFDFLVEVEYLNKSESPNHLVCHFLLHESGLIVHNDCAPCAIHEHKKGQGPERVPYPQTQRTPLRFAPLRVASLRLAPVRVQP